LQDFLTALGLLFAIEGLMFAAFPEATKRAMEQVIGTPERMLRAIGIACAIIGVLLVWLARRAL
jgi:uncharacterized protein